MTSPSFLLGVAPHRVTGSAPSLDRPLAKRLLAIGAEVLSLGAALSVAAAISVWIVVQGGAPTPLMHLYYLPILYAAARHGTLGAAFVAVVCGIAAGPAMPSATSASGVQSLEDWLTRLALFLLVGVVAAWLAHQQPAPLERSLRDAVVGRALRNAVRTDAIRVHFQPVIWLEDGSVLGAEALCRWFDKHGNSARPDLFIPVAERTGSIGAVGSAVLKQASIQAREWSHERPGEVTVGVNVSAVQLSDPAFLDELKHTVSKYLNTRTRLCLEVTETALMADPDVARTTLQAARELGLIVAIDDFGTGQSSLARLTGMPIDVIKIDRCFVSRVNDDEFSRAVIQAVVHLADSLGASTVAEGIETEEQLRALREIGCHMGQGYYFGRPAAAADMDWAPRRFPAL